VDGRAREAEVETKKEDVLLAAKELHILSRRPVTANEWGLAIDRLIVRVEDLRRAKREIP
jgi:hypothetical protein